MKNEYRFVSENNQHLHQILVDGEWKNLTGCTTVLSVIAKPALIQWAANMAVDYVENNSVIIDRLGIDSLPERVYEIEISKLEEARKAHTKRKEKAGDYGTKTHEEIEKIIKGAIDVFEGKIPKYTLPDESKSIQNFRNWAEENNVKFLESELHVHSKEMFTGGIVDFICEIEGQVWVGDIKTSGSGIYPEHFAQIAGYQLMLNEMGLYPNITGYLVLNLKESGEMLEKRSVSNEDNKKFFLAALEIYRQQERLKAQTI